MLLPRAQPGRPSHAWLPQNAHPLTESPPSILTFAEKAMAGQKVDKLPFLGAIMKGIATVELCLLNIIVGALAPGAFISCQRNRGL